MGKTRDFTKATPILDISFDDPYEKFAAEILKYGKLNINVKSNKTLAFEIQGMYLFAYCIFALKRSNMKSRLN